MTYNSNHMEGSMLTEAQTRMIFETSTIDAGDGILIDDILETVHHFRAIDYCIDVAEEPLSEDIIKHLHFILKNSTKDSTLSWFAVGDYKKRPNMVNGKETTAPANVHKELQKLLANYLKKKTIQIEDIISFHAQFEQILEYDKQSEKKTSSILLLGRFGFDGKNLERSGLFEYKDYGSKI